MGNCQAIDAAALVIQHPCGKIDRFYWPIIASEVMKLNPGHYVSLIIPLPVSGDHQDQKTVRFTRVKLLRPTDTLSLGHAYRLVTTQEVMKVLRAKKFAKSKRQNPETIEKIQASLEKQSLTSHEAEEKSSQVAKQARQRSNNNSGVTRSKSWRPKLHSISEFDV